MKICFMVSAMINGGAERVVSTLANNMSNTNDVTILMISVSQKDCFYTLNPNIRLIPLLKNNKKPTIFKKVKLIKRFIKTLNPDVVISFLPHVCIYSYFAIHNTNIPLIVSERNDPNQYPLIYKILLKFVFKKANYCVFQTEDAAKWYSIKKNKYSIIYNPVKLTYIPNLGENIIRKNNIVCVARLFKQKNILLLIDSFYYFLNQFPNYVLDIYGNGKEETNIKKRIKELGIEKNVNFKGSDPLWHEKEYNAGCFVLSSNYEGMPNSLLEAAILGIPCVATDCPIGGSKEIAKICPNVKLVEVKDKEQMTKALIDSVNMNSKFIKIPSQFDENYITSQWLKIISNLAK